MSAAARGSEFEAEVATFLRAAGFEVTTNAKSARPRQTDLFAKSDEVDLLIEAKNQKRNVDVSEVDSLRSRLNRISSDIVGAIFTTSELTRGAIQAIESDRQREVIAFVRKEIEQLRSGRQNLSTLIDRKRRELRTQGKAWFGSSINPEFVAVKLPAGGIEFRIGRVAKSFFESRSGFGSPFYALQIPDTGWGTVGGEGARLSIELALNSVRDLRNIIGYLHQKFGLSNKGMFSIQQSGSCWYGAGAENFLHAVDHWRQRYAQSQSKTFHHSEECVYFDQFRNGWIQLSSQQRIDLESRRAPYATFLHRSDLVIQLPGLPVELSPFLKLCKYTNNDWAHFEHVGGRLTVRLRLKKHIALAVVGTAISKESLSGGSRSQQHIVVGVVARNSFYRKKSLPRELLRPDVPPLDGLNETELLVCALRDWHDDGDIVDRYSLQGFELTVAGVGLVIRPFGTWNKILKRARDSALS
jgi:Holliday junction resolvase